MCHICNTTCIHYIIYPPPPTIHPLHPPQRQLPKPSVDVENIIFHQPAPNNLFCWIMGTTSISNSKPNTPHNSTRWAPTSFFKWGYLWPPISRVAKPNKSSFIWANYYNSQIPQTWINDIFGEIPFTFNHLLDPFGVSLVYGWLSGAHLVRSSTSKVHGKAWAAQQAWSKKITATNKPPKKSKPL